MAKPQKPITQDYIVLQPFRFNGVWVHPEGNKTIPLLPSQAAMLLINGKVGKPAIKANDAKKEGK